LPSSAMTPTATATSAEVVYEIDSA
jgi:hypothetical protein